MPTRRTLFSMQTALHNSFHHRNSMRNDLYYSQHVIISRYRHCSTLKHLIVDSRHLIITRQTQNQRAMLNFPVRLGGPDKSLQWAIFRRFRFHLALSSVVMFRSIPRSALWNYNNRQSEWYALKLRYTVTRKSGNVRNLNMFCAKLFSSYRSGLLETARNF